MWSAQGRSGEGGHSCPGGHKHADAQSCAGCLLLGVDAQLPVVCCGPFRSDMGKPPSLSWLGTRVILTVAHMYLSEPFSPAAFQSASASPRT